MMKKLKLYIKNTRFTLAILLFVLISYNVQAQTTCSGTANIPVSGSTTINGVTITPSFTGSVSTYGSNFTSCSTYTTTAGSMWVGSAGVWSVTLNFNKPVNNLLFVLTAAGQSANENFIFNSNGGTVTITDQGSCFSSISGNTLLSGLGAPAGGGGGYFTISAPSPYTQLVINGAGGQNGSLLAICQASILACSAGNTAPTIGSNKIANSCPATTGDLTTLVTSTPPSGTTITYHTGSPATTANKISNPTTASTGTYYAAYWDATNNCYSPVSQPIYVAMCLTNTCPTTTVDLTTHTTGTPPSGTTLQWHTSNVPSSGTLVSNPTAVGNGTYYATYYDATANCYSAVSTPLSVTINSCIPDTDGDGLTDDIDLDDDNDGILDTVEYGQCSSAIPANGAYVKQNLYLEDFGTLPNLGSSSSNTYGILQTIPSWSANVTGMTYDTTDGVTDGNWTLTVNPNYIDDFSTNIWNGTSLFDSQWLDTLDYTSGDVNGLFFAANPNDAPVGGSQLYRTPNIIVLPNVPLKASLWLLNMKKVGASGTDPIIKIDIVNASDNSIISTSTQSVAETGLWTEVSTTFSTGTTATSVYIRITNMVTSASGSGNDFGIDGISLDLTFCDLDSDGIPNYLDLDSDNDGCLDALEGGANIASSQLVNAGGTVTVGTGSTAANQNLCATSTCVDANGVPTIVSGGQSIGDSQNATIQSGCFCYKPAQTTGTTLDTNHGITALGRAGADNGNWPMARKGAWTALEAKTKGFVINRIPTTAQVIAIANPVEGMMVYDEEADCLKIYTTTDNGATYSWQCFNTQTCPE